MSNFTVAHQAWRVYRTRLTCSSQSRAAPFGVVARKRWFSCGFGKRSDDKQPSPKIHPMLTLDTDDSN